MALRRDDIVQADREHMSDIDRAEKLSEREVETTVLKFLGTISLKTSHHGSNKSSEKCL